VRRPIESIVVIIVVWPGIGKNRDWAAQVTFSCDNSARSSAHWQWKQPRRSPKHLSHAARTIVIHCFTVFLTVCYNVCSQSKMLQHVLSLPRGGVIISPQFFVSCTGYQTAIEFVSRLPAVFSRHWPSKHPSTSPSPTTTTWYQTWTDANSALLALELVSPPERLRNWVTEVFQLLVLKFGTVYHLHCGLWTWRLTHFLPICLHCVMRSQRLVTVDSWRYINFLYVFMYVYIWIGHERFDIYLNVV